MGPVGSVVRATVVAGLSTVALISALTALRVRSATQPPRRPAPGVDFAALGLPVRDVAFPAADGIELAGWTLPGGPGASAIVLCHDWGAARESLLPLAIQLHERGFAVLLFDFRGHGSSGGKGSTLGLEEARDVAGAVLETGRIAGANGQRVGVYGAGMGAHAAVLAARERPEIVALVLDGLYPSAVFALRERFYGPWGGRLPRPEFLPAAMFSLMTGVRPGRERAEAVLPGLLGREVLLLAPVGDTALTAEIERMYAGIPDQDDVDGNLAAVPASGGGGLYGAERARHHRGIEEFFTTRLRRRPDGPPEP